MSSLVLPLSFVTIEDISRNHNSTRTKLMASGERLMASQGVQGVSVEAIARDAGQANNAAVNYHFGDRDKLVQAIWKIREEAIDQDRATRLEKIDELGLGDDLEAVAEVLLAPVANQVDRAGSQSYARFRIQYIVATSLDQHFALPTRPGYMAIFERLHRIAGLDREDLLQRLSPFNLGFLAALIDFDNRTNQNLPTSSLEAVLRSAILILKAGLAVPH
ncbi:TetR family transcriptional regulator [Asticcacaulis sp. BYS171W]|uniref:TetR family transcriptional regulator n=1 Tax=Asticcacaulis aquaticus TaxID=2984212 RepID=A0ABT5HZ10_9CAUL|nr:TetR family transcriptional regulator [Asticcacaulis aquaticus]MDC7685315.1 TetR family transcriptional regulator [Asticcacaulis aquaticus]